MTPSSPLARMRTTVSCRIEHVLGIASMACAGILLSACMDVNSDQAMAAVTEINAHYQSCYEKTLASQGTRIYKASTQTILVALGASLTEMDMDITAIDDDGGFIYVKATAPAPLPLAENEWQTAMETDLPELRDIVAKHVGFRNKSTPTYEKHIVEALK